MSMAQTPSSAVPHAKTDLASGDVPRAYELAVRLHREGKLAPAQALYGEILRSDPRHAGALHMLGTVGQQAVQAQAGMVLIGRSVCMYPTEAAD